MRSVTSIVLVFAVAPLLIVSGTRCRAEAVAKTSSPASLRVIRGDYERTLTLTGEVTAAKSDSVVIPRLPTWQATVRWLILDGTEVKEGERVAEIDTGELATQVSQREVALERAQRELELKRMEVAAGLETRKIDVERRQHALDVAVINAAKPVGVVSRRQYDEAQLQLEGAKTDRAKAADLLSSFREASRKEIENLELTVTRTRRELQLARDSVAAATLVAPRDGMASVTDHPWEGRRLRAGDMAFVGMPVVTMPDLSSLRVTAILWDVDDGDIRVGDSASVELDAFPGRTYPAKITAISPVASDRAGESLRKAFEVTAELTKSDTESIRPGYSARLVVRREILRGALVAPRAAIDLETNPPRIHLADGTVKDVVIAACNTTVCAVTSGVAEGTALKSRWERAGDN